MSADTVRESGNTTEALDVLMEKPTVTLPVAGRTINVKKLSLRTLPLVTGILQPVAADFFSIVRVNESGEQVLSPERILPLITNHTEPVVTALAALTDDLTSDEIFDLDLEDVVVLARATIEINVRFFTTKVLPHLKIDGLLPSEESTSEPMAALS